MAGIPKRFPIGWSLGAHVCRWHLGSAATGQRSWERPFDQFLPQRLTACNQETAIEIARRLAQADKPISCGPEMMHLSNDGPLADTVARAITLLQPVSAT